MKCRICGKEKDRADIIEGMCSDCFQIEAQKLRGIHEEALEMAEQKINEDAPHGDKMQHDPFSGQGSTVGRISKEQFLQGPTTRKVFILALLRMAGIYEEEKQKKVIADLEWLIENELDSFWGKDIRIVTGNNLKGHRVLASRNNTYIVELEE